MRSYEIYKDWEQYHNRVVLIDGLKYRLKVSTLNAIYPYPEKKISVAAYPVNKNSKHYKEVKAVLKDDWSTDILDSDIDVQCDILAQLSS